MPVATDFVLAGGAEIADYYETSATWRLTVRGAGGLPLVTVVPAAGGGGEEIVYVHHDMKGSTVALTVPGGSGPAESYTYSDYGAPQSGTWLAYQYAGYRYDSETELYNMPARSYSPALGRFLQSDPAGFRGGFNLYAYAGNDPVNSEDHSGQSPDGGGLTITLSESVAGWFGPAMLVGVTGYVPGIVVAADAPGPLTVNTFNTYREVTYRAHSVNKDGSLGSVVNGDINLHETVLKATPGSRPKTCTPSCDESFPDFEDTQGAGRGQFLDVKRVWTFNRRPVAVWDPEQKRPASAEILHEEYGNDPKRYFQMTYEHQ
jgi:RHS repeat-associated protein